MGGADATPSRTAQLPPAASATAASMAARKCRATQSRVAASGAPRASVPSTQLGRSGAIHVAKLRSPIRVRSAAQARLLWHAL